MTGVPGGIFFVIGEPGGFGPGNCKGRCNCVYGVCGEVSDLDKFAVVGGFPADKVPRTATGRGRVLEALFTDNMCLWVGGISRRAGFDQLGSVYFV